MDGRNTAGLRAPRGGRGRGHARRRRLLGRHVDAATTSRSPSSARGAAPSRSRSWRWSSRGRTQTGNKVKYTGSRGLGDVPHDRASQSGNAARPGRPARPRRDGRVRTRRVPSSRSTTSSTSPPTRPTPRRRSSTLGYRRRRQDDRRLHQERREGPHLVQHGQLHRRPPRPTWDDVDGRRQGRRRERLVRRRSSPAPTPAGRAPTGSRTSCCARRAPTSTTSGSPASTSGTRPRSRRPSRTFGKVIADTLRRRDDRQQHELRRRRQPAVHRPARLPVPPPGKLHHRLLQGAGWRRRRRVRLLPDAGHQPDFAGAFTGAGDLFGLFSTSPQPRTCSST